MGETQTSDGLEASDGTEETLRHSGTISFEKGDGELVIIRVWDPSGSSTIAPASKAYARGNRTKPYAHGPNIYAGRMRAFAEAPVNEAFGSWTEFTDGRAELEVPACKDGKTVGRYLLTREQRDKLLRGEQAQVEFHPYADFIGTPEPMWLQAEDENGYTVEVTYTPTVVGPPTANNAETWGRRGENQASGEHNAGVKDPEGIIYFIVGDGNLTKLRLRGSSNDLFTEFTDDMDVAILPAYDQYGRQIGRYRLTREERDKILSGNPGKVEFLLDDKNFTGDPQPCEVQVEDEYGYVISAYYQPHVEDKGATPTKTPARPAKTAEADKAATPKTGDGFRAWPYMVGMAAAFAALLLLSERRRKCKRRVE